MAPAHKDIIERFTHTPEIRNPTQRRKTEKAGYQIDLVGYVVIHIDS
jgi:hypothetical protein